MSPTHNDLVTVQHRDDSLGIGGRAQDVDDSLRERAVSPPIATACLVILTVLALFYTLYFGRAILAPVTMAIVLALVLRPIVAFFSRWHVPAAVTASGIFVAMLALVLLATSLLSKPARNWIEKAPRTLADVRREIGAVSEPLAKLQQAKEEVDEITEIPGKREVTKVELQQPSVTGKTLNATGGYITSVTITLVLLFFLMAAGDRLLEKAVEAAPEWRQKKEVVNKFREIEKRISRYLGSVTLINIGLGVVIGAGLWAIGMPNPVLWGVLAAGLNYIPIAGAFLGATIVGFAALTAFDGPSLNALLAPAVYIVANMIEANLVTPTILGRSTDINPIAILLAVFLFGWIWGVVGIFLAVPLLLVAKIFCSSYEKLRPYAILLSN